MEYEMQDEPQGMEEKPEGDRDGGVVEDHIALKHQSSVAAEDYPKEDRAAQSLVQKDKKKQR